MGLLSDLGQMLDQEESNKLQPQLRRVGIRQFLKIFQKYKNWQKTTDPLIIKWGEEIEGNFLKFNQKNELQLNLQRLPEEYKNPPFNLMPEYGKWMLEMIPKNPYSSKNNFKQVIDSIKQRYDFLQGKSRIALTIPVIPFLGVRDPKQQNFDNSITQSLYIDDKHIDDHIRFRTLTKNIRLRRGRTVEMNVPIFIDENTKMEEIAKTEPNPKFIHLDAMAFGMGMSCLQCTFSTKNLSHARYLYDQMHVISPIFLAITAATPFHKGKMANWDARWNIVAGSVDDRRQEERDPKSQSYLPNARYSEANLFLWDGPFNKPKYNDMKLNINPETREFLKKSAEEMNIAIDDYLAEHIANIFKREIMIVHENFKTMGDDSNILFEMLNGTNWNSVRLKIPIDDEIGWRVQFRTMEIQLMADQNAAYSLFIHFFTRVLHQAMDLNLYMPMSLIKQNFDRAHEVDAVRRTKFWFRTNIFDQGEPVLEELTIEEILFGREAFPGIYNYIEEMMQKELEENQEGKKILSSIGKYFKSIATGKRRTLAQWIREYINDHPDYKHDSILSKKTMDQLLITLNDISKGTQKDENFKPIFEEI